MDYHLKDSPRTLAKAVVGKCKEDGISDVRGVWLSVITLLGLSLSCLASQPLWPHPHPLCFLLCLGWRRWETKRRIVHFVCVRGWVGVVCLCLHMFSSKSLYYMFLPKGKCPLCLVSCTVCAFVASVWVFVCVCVCVGWEGHLLLACHQSQVAGDTRSVTGGYTLAHMHTHTHLAECKTAQVATINL